jgi:DNA-binding GntR family transcriptional regulator
MASLQQEKEAVLRAIDTVPPEALPNLRRIVELFADAVVQKREREWSEFQQDFEQEMAAWNEASDEALTEFDRQAQALP